MKKVLLLGLTLALFLSNAAAQDSLNVRHLYNWDDPLIPGNENGTRYNDVWGHAMDGREYAFLGSTMGLHIFDVTNPNLPVLVDHVPGRYLGSGVTHRDYKVYSGHLYAVCDQGPSSLQIMDLSYLPDSVHVVYDSQELLIRAHNIQVDTVNARLYVSGGEHHFRILSLADPASPVLLSNCEADIPWWGGSIGYVHDCFVRDNIVWCNDEDGMHVVDFSDVEQPLLLGSLTQYMDQGYNHSGWLNDVGTTYVMADETHGSPLKFVDATQLDDLEVINYVTPGTHLYSVPHNPFFHGDMVHVAYYSDGYWLWDASDPMDLRLLGFYDMSLMPHSLGFRGAWGVYPYLPSGIVLVSDMQRGLWLLDISEAVSIKETLKEPEFMILPTLTMGSVEVHARAGNTGAYSIDVLDMQGRTIFASREIRGRTELDLTPHPSGVYLVHVLQNGVTSTQRVVKTDYR